MLRKFNAKLLAGAITLGLAGLSVPPPPAQAALSINVQVGFNDFYVALRPYGRWFHHPRWGDVWQPQVADFHPYRDGHWEYTDVYGWLWVSDYSWGDVPFHYGRWVYDPVSGWLWIPGYIWAPAWVLWRSGDGYLGWAPMPPDSAFLAGDEIYPAQYDFDQQYVNWYGPNYGPNWFATNWVFVNPAHFADRDYRRYAVMGGGQAARIYDQTRNVTHYATANNYVVNRSVDPAIIGRARGRPVNPVPLRQAIRANAPVAPIEVGRNIQQTERRVHGGNPQAPATARAEPLNPAMVGREHARASAPPAAQERGNRANREFAQPAPGHGQAPNAAERGPGQREAIAPPENRGLPSGTPAPRERPGREARLPPAPQANPAFQAPPAPRERQGREARSAPAPQAGPPAGFEGPPPGFATGPRQRAENGSGRRAPFEAPPAAAPAAPPPQFAFRGGRGGGGGPPPGFAPNAGRPPAAFGGGGPPGHGGPPPAPPANAGGPPSGGGGAPGHGNGPPDQGGGHGRGHEH